MNERRLQRLLKLKPTNKGMLICASVCGVLVFFGSLSSLFFSKEHWGLSRRSISNSQNDSEDGSDLSHRTKRGARIYKETESQRISRLQKAAIASIEQQKRKAAEQTVNKPLVRNPFGKQGQLTAEAALAANLTDVEKNDVDQRLKRFWEKETQEFAARARLNTVESNEDTGVYVYDIDAREDRGKVNLQQLVDSLNEAVGVEKQKILTKGVGPYDCFAGMGRFDVRLEFITNENKCRVDYINPKSKLTSRFTIIGMDEFRSRFGDSFDIK